MASARLIFRKDEFSLSKIGPKVGKGHATVLHAQKVIKNAIASLDRENRDIASKFNQIIGDC